MVPLFSAYLEIWINEKKRGKILLFEHLSYEEACHWLFRYFYINVPENRTVTWVSGETFDNARYYVPMDDWEYKLKEYYVQVKIEK